MVFDIHCICILRDDMTLTRLLLILIRMSMDGSAPLRVEDDQGNCPNSPASVEGGQASHAPPVNEPEHAIGGAIDIIQ